MQGGVTKLTSVVATIWTRVRQTVQLLSHPTSPEEVEGPATEFGSKRWCAPGEGEKRSWVESGQGGGITR